MLNKLERKLGRYAIPHLINYLIGGYALGYVLYMMSGIAHLDILSYLSLNPYAIVHDFQIWRIITWILIPEMQNPFFALIMMFFYWQLGNMLESTWGTFRFNLYIFGGMFFTVIGAFIAYAIYLGLGIPLLPGDIGKLVSGGISTYYINMSIFLAYAVSYPDMTVLLYFIIPIKMKWMAVVYGVWFVWSLFSALSSGAMGVSVAITLVMSLLNFVIFFFATRNYHGMSPHEFRRKQEFKRKVNHATRNRNGGGAGPFGGGNPFGAGPFGNNAGSAPQGGGERQISRHKCAICGRTELTNPELEFRFCSKCNGNYEYCNDHLFTHTHVK